jgi:hypothetical protein
MDPKGVPRAFLEEGTLAISREGSPPASPSPQLMTILKPGQVAVSDDRGFEATIETRELFTPRSGETHKTSAASVLLFDRDKNVMLHKRPPK